MKGTVQQVAARQVLSAIDLECVKDEAQADANILTNALMRCC